jgi:ABC-2 type transport system permease protein
MRTWSRPAHEVAVVGAVGAQVYHLARRSVIRQARQPANVVAPVIFPLGLLAVNSGGLQSATLIPGFPTDRFVAFAFAIPFLHGALFATMNAGADLARDIQTGFLNRLALTPMGGVALVVGQLAGVAAVALVQAAFYITTAYVVGVYPKAGPGGVLTLLLLAVAIAVGFGAVGVFMALRTGSAEAVQGLFPVLFVFLLVSSMNFPRNLIEADWFRWLANVNPVSYLIEGVRSLIIQGWNAEALGLAFAITAALLTASLAASAFALKQRMTRT